MNKLVYLFELDSVRNSRAQVQTAQRALFEEIVLNGNVVVLSQNQLSDSKGFLAALADDDTSVFEDILELCRQKRIRVSLYEHYLSPSQYLQTQFEDNKDFIFSVFRELSSTPAVQADLQQAVHSALKYSDYKWLDSVPANVTASQKAFLRRYVQLILTLSSSDVPLNPAGNPDFTLCDVLNKALEKVSEDIAADLVQAKTGLDETQINRRSCWYPLLKKAESRIVIDLCYNYRVEASISGVSKHYDTAFDDSFWQDFMQRLQHYQTGVTGTVGSAPLQENNLFDYDLNLSFWHTARRICCREIRTPLSDHRYEEHRIRDRFRNVLRLLGVNLKILATVCILFVTFTLLAIAMNVAQDSVQQLVYTVYNGGKQSWWILFAFTVLFSLVSSIIGELTNMPDILVTVKNFLFLFVDYGRIMTFKRGAAWRNDGKLH